MAYQHMPYGKYEPGETPHILHHINNRLYGSFEIDMNEEAFGQMNILHPNVHHHIHIGPDTGHFLLAFPDSTVVFVSQDAGWCPSNQPNLIFINNFVHDVTLRGGKDTIVGTAGTVGGIMNWPSSLKYSTAPIIFYYSRSGPGVADSSMTWHAYPDDSGRYRVIMAPYHVNRFGDTLKFSKNYQPTQITLKVKNIPKIFKTFNCYWDSSLNASVIQGECC